MAAYAVYRCVNGWKIAEKGEEDEEDFVPEWNLTDAMILLGCLPDVQRLSISVDNGFIHPWDVNMSAFVSALGVNELQEALCPELEELYMAPFLGRGEQLHNLCKQRPKLQLSDDHDSRQFMPDRTEVRGDSHDLSGPEELPVVGTPFLGDTKYI